MIIAVEMKHVKTKHETLQYGMSLECYDAIKIPFILRTKNSAVNLAIELLQEVVFAQGLHVICNNTFVILGKHTERAVILIQFSSDTEIMRYTNTVNKSVDIL